jgi:hypothetical protein
MDQRIEPVIGAMAATPTSPPDVAAPRIVRFLPAVLVLGILLFYAAFVPRFFVGDDWLWLLQARRFASDPSACFDRTAYGYFRPLFVLVLGLEFRLFGVHPLAFGALNVLLHALNAWLFCRLLVQLQLPWVARVVAGTFFAFFLLTSTVVAWISTGADLLALTFILMSSLLLDEYHRSFAWRRLLGLVALGLLATMSKEIGWVSVLLVFLHAAVVGRNPFGRRYALGTAVLLVTFSGYLALYFAMRTTVDKRLGMGVKFGENLWYLYVYIFLPLSKRFVAGLPASLRAFLSFLHLGAIVVVPAALIWTLRKARPNQRALLLAPLVLLAPIAAFDWTFHLTSAYPEQTASRFMYVAIPGAATLIGSVTAVLLARLRLRPWVVLVPLLGLFTGVNFVGAHGVTRLYAADQRLAKSLFEAFVAAGPRANACDVIVLEPNAGLAPEDLPTPGMLAAEYALASGRQAVFRIDAAPADGAPGGRDACRMRWLPEQRRFTIDPLSP